MFHRSHSAIRTGRSCLWLIAKSCFTINLKASKFPKILEAASSEYLFDKN